MCGASLPYFLAIRRISLIRSYLLLSAYYFAVTIKRTSRISAYLYFDPSRPLPRACAWAWHLRICDLRPFLALNDHAKDSNGVVGLVASRALESKSEPSAPSSQTVSVTDRLESSRSFKRRSYTREDKLRVLKFYKDNGRNLYKTCQQFNLNTKNVLRWIKEEKKGARLDPTNKVGWGSLAKKKEQRNGRWKLASRSVEFPLLLMIWKIQKSIWKTTRWIQVMTSTIAVTMKTPLTIWVVMIWRLTLFIYWVTTIWLKTNQLRT